jgi:hypothetical protein
MSSWDVPAPPPLPSQTGVALDTPPRVLRRGELEPALQAARSTSDEIVAATVTQREAALAAEREKEQAARESEIRNANEVREREAREAALRAQIEALDATASELRQNALLRGVKWGLGLLSAGLLFRWVSDSEGDKRTQRRRQQRAP